MHMSLFYGQVTGLSSAKKLTLPNGVIDAASNATPIVVTSTGHNLQTGDWVEITTVVGNTAANRRAQVKRLTADTFSLDESAGNGAYVSGGLWRKFWRGDVVVLLQAETQDIRWRDDGVDPTSSLGMVLHADESPTVYRGDMARLSLIETAASAKVNFTVMTEGVH